jgi:mannosyltransferase
MSVTGAGRAPGEAPAPTEEAPAGGSAAAAPAARGRRWKSIWPVIAPAILPAGVTTALGLWGLARRSALSNDEAATSIAARLSLGQLAHLLVHIDAVHGLYYFLMHGWVAIGSSPAALRVPSLIAMVVGAALVSVLATQLSGSGWAGLLAGLIMAVTPSISYYAQTARPYAMVVACVAGSTLALLAALRTDAAEQEAGARRVRRAWMLYGGLITLGGYFNELSLLVLAAHGVTILLSRSPFAVLRRWAIAGVIGAALVAPVGLLSLIEHSSVSFIGRPDITGIRFLLQDYFGVTAGAAAIVGACMIVALLPVPGQPRWWRGGITLPSVALPLMIVPAALLIGESFAGPALYIDRYVLYGEIGVAVLAGAGLYRAGQWLATAARQRWLVSVPAALVCVAVLVLQLGPQRDIRVPSSRLYDFTAPAKYVGARARPGDGALYFNDFFRKDRLIYPDDFRNTTDFGQAESPGQAGTFRGTDTPFSVVGPLMLTYRRIWVIGDFPSQSLTDPLLRKQSALLLTDFRLASKRHFRGIDVTLWLRRS